MEFGSYGSSSDLAKMSIVLCCLLCINAGKAEAWQCSLDVSGVVHVGERVPVSATGVYWSVFIDGDPSGRDAAAGFGNFSLGEEQLFPLEEALSLQLFVDGAFRDVPFDVEEATGLGYRFREI